MIPVDLLLACALDAAIGDPRWLPHPVRAMGQLAGWFEKGIRCLHPGPRALRLAGIALAFALPCLAFSTGWILIAGGKSIHDWVGRGIAICLACSTLAWRDLVGHVSTVERSLKAGYLTEARKAVSQIVGRDTEGLSEREVVRATIETT
ncbi:MAG TPA: CobD/CbiB family cobalamin biosynthesis protein, partial [Nitrospira sp.]